MLLRFLFLISSFNPLLPAAQTCRHTKLSRQFDLRVQLQRREGDDEHSGIIHIRIYSKGKATPRQRLELPSALLYSSEYAGCSNVRSYSTGWGNQREVVDQDFGDIVVADLNFDGRDDLAVKHDSGGNSGAYYTFYLQQPDGTFALHAFLTREVQVFPEKRDRRRRELTAAWPHYCGVGLHTYRCATDGNTYRFVRRKMLGNCEY
ncbi:XAC2610-related protein [Flaviaesturariibacter aridisoli]|uniref:VCBS repeat-containing protein n=1 Tax=Flaviaesturariibacter aridisoli TaxID=2545761 RepID=A0A4R4E022_9BACT|nr:hypothetical protein [Flaviaesturariibacter aridisoli]TCZ70465.1 hypothetical protein E0486_10945 [Flaviaesturariibacter aridisoli]